MRTVRTSSGRTVTIGHATVVKVGDPESMYVEAEKTRRAREIAERSHTFFVPKILGQDTAAGSITLERVPTIQPLRNALGRGTSADELAERVGACLAIIHRELELPASMRQTLPQELRGPGPETWIHGDFNAENVGVRSDTGALVVLDWQMTSRHGGSATWGSPWFDVIWFANYLLWNPTLEHLRGDASRRFLRSFVLSYRRQGGIPETWDDVVSYARHFFRTKRPDRWTNTVWYRRPLIWRSQRLTDAFLNELTSLGDVE